jgi:ABC-type polysaccharide/polyol phosphate transport system ATPase subunit
MLAQLCTRAIWLEEGHVRGDGSFHDIQSRYLAAVEQAGPR